MGEDGDSQVTFFRYPDGKPLLSLPTTLNDLVALVYGMPAAGSGRSSLLALDSGGSRPDAGGLYRLDARIVDGQPALQATKILTLSGPTAMAIATDGSLLLTIRGAASSPPGAKPGQLLRVQATW
jgi:hypothetical protein